MEHDYIHFGPYTIEIEGRVVRKGSRNVPGPKGKPLMPRAVQLLILLIEKRGAVVRATDVKRILDQHGAEEDKKREFARYISYLRRSLGKKFDGFVVTVSSKRDPKNEGGYKFVGSVSFTDRDDLGEPTAGAQEAKEQLAAVSSHAPETETDYDVAFAELVTSSKDSKITAYPGFGWGSTLSLQDAPEYKGWLMSDVELVFKRRNPFGIDRQKQKEYKDYFKRFYDEKRFNEDNTKFMLERNPVAFSDAPSLCLNVRSCKYSHVQFYRDNIANSYERNALIEELITGSLCAEFPHSLCMHAAIITADHKLLRTQRSQKVGYYPGAWSCSVEENLAASDLTAGKKSRIEKWGLRLLKEELHLTERSTTPEKMRLLSVFLESDILNISLCAEITLTLPSSQLDIILKGHRRTDYEFTSWNYLEMDKNILLREIMQPTLGYHPTSGYRLLQILLKHFGAPSQSDIAALRAASSSRVQAAQGMAVRHRE